MHLDDTPFPVLARGKTRTGRLWTATRVDPPFGGPDPPAAAYLYSPDRSGTHAEGWLAGCAGIIQAGAFSGFGRLCEPHRKPGVIVEAACWAHARRKFFEMAELQRRRSPSSWCHASIDLLGRLPGHPAKRFAELLPWNWSPPAAALKAA